ncbi:histidine phosphatase family protein [Nocardioides montaniterrae]
MGLILLARHGQASFGADDYDVLSETGHEQARLLGRWLAAQGAAPAHGIHGGMRRQRETWEGIAEGLDQLDQPDLPDDPAEVDTGWVEFDHLGVLDRHAEATGAAIDHGADRRTFQQHFEVATAHWASGAEGYPETYADFVGRSLRALERAADATGPTLVVSSGGVIAAIAATLVAPGATIEQIAPIWQRFNTVMVNTGVTRIIVGPTGARLLTFNEHPHLTREQVTYR